MLAAAVEAIANNFFDDGSAGNYSANFKSGVDTVYVYNEEDEMQYPVTEDLFNMVINELVPEYFFQAYVNHRSFVHFGPKFQMIPFATVGLTLSTEEVYKVFNEFRIGGSKRTQTPLTRRIIN